MAGLYRPPTMPGAEKSKREGPSGKQLRNMGIGLRTFSGGDSLNWGKLGLGLCFERSIVN